MSALNLYQLITAQRSHHAGMSFYYSLRPFKFKWHQSMLSLLIAVSLFGFSCVDYRGGDEEGIEEVRKPRPRPPFRDDPWFEKYVIEGGGMGLHAQLALSPGGQLGVAYWSTDGEEGALCEGIEVDDPPLEVRCNCTNFYYTNS